MDRSPRGKPAVSADGRVALRVGMAQRDKTQKADFRQLFASISGAGEEIRTLDVHLGKVALYR